MPLPLLPSALLAVIENIFAAYHDFIAQADLNDPKDFSTRYTAGKVALQHITMLLALLHSIKAVSEHDTELQIIIAAAQTELDGLTTTHDD